MAQGSSNILVGTPCYDGTVSHFYMRSYLALQQSCRERGIGLDLLMLAGDSLVTRARNRIVAEFLDASRFTHLMFIDADIGYDAGEFLRLVERDTDIAAGIYPLKRIDWAKVRERALRGDTDLEAAALGYVLSGRTSAKGTIRVTGRAGFASVDHAGTGFMLIRRNVFEAMADRHPEAAFIHSHLTTGAAPAPKLQYAFFDTSIDREAGTYLSEDYTFCRRWKAMGGEIWVDLKSRLTHYGSYAYRGDFSTQAERVDGKE